MTPVFTLTPRHFLGSYLTVLAWQGLAVVVEPSVSEPPRVESQLGAVEGSVVVVEFSTRDCLLDELVGLAELELSGGCVFPLHPMTTNANRLRHTMIGLFIRFPPLKSFLKNVRLDPFKLMFVEAIGL